MNVGSVLSSNHLGFLSKVRGMFGKHDPNADARSEGAESNADDAEAEDATKAKQQLESTKAKLKATQKQLAEGENRIRELSQKLQEMFAALKLLKSENEGMTASLQEAEAHIQQFANPEREAYVNKYALEKMTEEYAKFKEECAARELKLTLDLKRVQENLASRSAADEAAKAALRAEIRELRRERGIARPAGPGPAAYDGNMALAAVGDGPGKGAAVMNPSSGLRFKTAESQAAALVPVNTEGRAIPVASEAALKKKEAALQSSMAYLIEQGVLPPDATGLYDPLDPRDAARPPSTVVDFVYDAGEADKLAPAYAAAVAAAAAEAAGDHSGGGAAPPAFLENAIAVASDELHVHELHVDSFATHRPDAYGTPPFLVRQDAVDALLEHAHARQRGLAAVIAPGGAGKSHLLAAAAKALAAEFPKAILVTAFVGASGPSTDTRRLLRTICRFIARRLPARPGQGDLRAGSAMRDAAYERSERIVGLPDGDKVPERPRRAVPHGLEQLKAALPALLDEAAAAGRRVVVVLDGVSELHDLYAPPALEWLPGLLSASALVLLSLESAEELAAVRARAAVGLALELEPLGGGQRRELLTYLVTKYNTAVQTELARQKAEMRQKAEAELARLREERQQRRLQRERLRGPSRRKRKKAAAAAGGGGGGGGEPGGPADGGDSEPEGAAGEAEGEDRGLLGDYELEVMVEKRDAGVTLYLIMAVEYLLSLERRLPALEEAQALPGTLGGLVDQILDELEGRHGKELVRAALMLLESARFGLSEAELVQALQSEEGRVVGLDGVLDLDGEAFAGLQSPRDWRRLMNDLAPLLRPRGPGEVRGMDLRLRHGRVRAAVVARYCLHRCFWHRSASRSEMHVRLAAGYAAALAGPRPPADLPDEATAFERWGAAERLWQRVHAAEDLVYHQLCAGDWGGAEARLTDLAFVEEKSRSVDPYHLLTDYSAALDTPWRFAPPPDAAGGDAGGAGAAAGLSFVQRVRVLDFLSFVSMYAAVVAAHPEIVLQQAMNMPDASTVAKEALRVVGDARAEVAWFRHLNKSQLGDPCVLTLKCNGPVDCVAYAPDGRALATGSGDGFGGRLTVWDARSGTERARFGLPGAVRALSYAGDGRSLLCVSDEGTALICDTVTLKERARAVLLSARASGGALSIDGRRMALVARDGELSVWGVSARVGAAGQVARGRGGGAFCGHNKNRFFRDLCFHFDNIFIRFLPMISCAGGERGDEALRGAGRGPGGAAVAAHVRGDRARRPAGSGGHGAGHGQGVLALADGGAGRDARAGGPPVRHRRRGLRRRRRAGVHVLAGPRGEGAARRADVGSSRMGSRRS